MLPTIFGEYGVVADPEVKFSENGKCWMRLRLVAKDRVRDTNGVWSDGDPMFIDCVVFGTQAEKLTDSVAKGDAIIVGGKLKPNKWTDKDGVEHTDMRIMADEVGVSTRFNTAQTPRYIEAMGGPVSPPSGGATQPPLDDSEPPF